MKLDNDCRITGKLTSPDTRAQATGLSNDNGRRESLRRKILEGPAEAISDQEVLEYLLTGGMHMVEARQTAGGLLGQFGTLAEVLKACPSQLQSVQGVCEARLATLMTANIFAHRTAGGAIKVRPVLSTWQDLIDYLTFDMAELSSERVRVLYLDRENRLIEDFHAAEGSLNDASIKPRNIIHRAMDLDAAGLLLVHNHPSGNPRPSRADIQITRRIADAGRPLGITLHDHLIIGRQGHVSLRSEHLF